MTTTTIPTCCTVASVPAVRSPVRSFPPTEPLAVRTARTAVALEASLTRFLTAADHNLGHLEVQAAHDVQELLRATTQRAAQARADATPLRCPVCGQPLTRSSPGHARPFQTRFGAITVQRTRGWCQRCRKWRTPAAAALGLEDPAGYSPAGQALAALAASKMPVADASLVLEQFTGVKLPRATLDREARRQGQRAQRLDALREQMHAEALRRGLGPAASALVIGDGAVWIWRLADDRWPQARQRLDF